MRLPELLGTFPPNQFFIYAACDEQYFDQFAWSFINSIKANNNDHIHIHIFNPRSDQLSASEKIPGLSISHEYVPEDMFTAAADRWQRDDLDEIEKQQLFRTHQAMIKGQDRDIRQRMQRTYYACARFIRLAELAQGPVFSMDIDAVVRGSLSPIRSFGTVAIHRITGAKARFLAGGIFLDGSDHSLGFLSKYADSIREFFEKDRVYWGIDQDQLEYMAINHQVSQLPMEFIDWNMRPGSIVWTAKGTRKSLGVFQSERQRYL
jgi:hypothetical protein